LVIAGLSLTLTACDGGPSAVAPTVKAEAVVDHRGDPVPLLAGKPIWAASRKHTAQENVSYHFRRDGADFGAATAEAYAIKARAFLDAPPKGALTLVRGNGDRLVYDPAANVFGVATSDGAPRTLFKPKEGRDYWDQQKAQEAKRTSGQRADRGADDKG
jgi:pyocin large subunit-like protein